ncbi:hypothetical protein [Methylobacterium frigidaeris]|uniref:Uncharacterized protein n=1 Tax=Methylobacterium frigidaeris TaxID=2038277 RepID=A0AA37HAN5_9HYPH|nr:hypothetical protein [Methylobacterium frigidaeris]PIK72559.1 hypothetical protein CS379_13275 [Methylobacterium frigidaeris]GJD61941.1 hypothetical protein MPEAHAMD_2090 [Methylobacterium frigidaeris]
MIGRLISTLRPHKLPDDRDAVPEETVLAAPPDEIAQFPPMVPLAPPQAVNDDPDGALCDAVEAALRAAGYLPEPPVG